MRRLALKFLVVIGMGVVGLTSSASASTAESMGTCGPWCASVSEFGVCSQEAIQAACRQLCDGMTSGMCGQGSCGAGTFWVMCASGEQ